MIGRAERLECFLVAEDDDGDSDVNKVGGDLKIQYIILVIIH
jgi:hypothetical protein